MFKSTRALCALILVVPAWLGVAPALAEQAARSGNPIFDRTVDIVNERFYAPDALPAFNEAAAMLVAQMPNLRQAEPAVVSEAIDWVLASLASSHTGRFTQDRVNYYELTDVFRGAVRRDIRRLFPPDGRVTYAGIGIASNHFEGRTYVTDVYSGGSAAEAGLLPGDEILAVDGKPFAEIDSFKGRAGETAEITIRRDAEGEPVTVPVKVALIQPSEAFLTAISSSARVIDQDGYRLGYVRLWVYTREEVTGILYEVLGRGILSDVDGLVLDLRSRWGGAPGDAAETFVGRAANMEMVDRGGARRAVTFRWPKAVVAIIDEGTRSGMEVLAFSLQKNGVPLVGVPTAGNVVAGTAYLLPDDSLLEVAVADVFVDGIRLEGNPVQPDISAPFDLRHAAGRDPQLDAAATELVRRLTEAAGTVN